MHWKKVLPTVLLLLSGLLVLAQKPLPEIRKTGDKHTFYLDEEPFLILGAQLWNSSVWPEITDQFWEQAKTLGCNTIEAPIYWQNIEPEPGRFNFRELDHLILSAREQNLRLVLLWFGSYKNGRSQYAPPWVLENTERYPRMRNAAGEEIYVLSAVSENNREADQSAFVAVMKHLKEIDEAHQTVIMMQVENEPGSMWTNRDYSPAANQLYEAPVPVDILRKLNKSRGNWEQVFGVDGPEAFNAYHIARYIDRIAEAGREVYNLPMYANVWIRENAFQRPGEYPSGGPTSNMIDLWKAAAPHLDLLALDVYHGNPNIFNQLCDNYDRPDNALFVPEMGNGHNFARFQFYAIGNYNAIGVAPYGIDPFHVDPHDQRNKDQLDGRFDGIARNYHLLSGAIQPITQLQGTGNLRAVGEEEGMSEQLVRLNGYDVLFRYGFPTYKDRSQRTGRALIGQTGPDEFLLIGFDAKFQFRPTYGSGYNAAEYVLVEQGHYEGGRWVRERIWNGDALYHATLPHEGAILKIKLRRVETPDGARIRANFDKN
ncbi:DUF5597 domain-containing protein [Flavilitoribacter nigricans]|uniref:Glycoside hydrolase n=1 Tax=Flavilitoribacter nigricans (strain ATCC 23147 / DSM 23189 / NBRC 102662 / NCIMB 1420 / SS-2) TaxID=1122177 RepID=A0A2D0NHH8_FLAN2|nr:DUF5597 domain-containing protein [Flavilitoribacter nigricans]PHN07868.1 glycoside hydrolase [Flavilitoribacter nigricans DSM 23189 = NBRC 102662]